MERLTYDFCIGNTHNTHCWQVKGADNSLCKDVCIEQGDNGCEECPIKKAFDRLAAYEDTGLEPEEINSIFIYSVIEENRRLKKFSQAEKDGRLVVLPPNAQLTLEELREMDEEPVWNDTMKKWVLVDLTWEYGERTVDADGKWRDLGDRYYRRRPEEGTA